MAPHFALVGHARCRGRLRPCRRVASHSASAHTSHQQQAQHHALRRISSITSHALLLFSPAARRHALRAAAIRF